MINILYYEPSSGYGGSSLCLLSWLKKLDRNKYKAVVLFHNIGPNTKGIQKIGIETIKVPFKRLFREGNLLVISYILFAINFIIYDIPTAFYIYWFIRRNRIKIIHINIPVISGIPGIIAARAANIPCICHLHDTKIPVRREKYFIKWVTCIIALTEKARQIYKVEYPGIRLEVIPNGIDIDEFEIHIDKSLLKSEFRINNTEFVIGIVGRLVNGKGFPIFIKAARMIIDKYDNTKFMIVGNDPEKNRTYETNLKALTKHLKIENKIIFTGWREDIKEVISIFDVLVQATTTFPEGFGMTVLEAMALEKPVVVTNVPGPSEIVEEGISGYIVPPGDVEMLAGAIIKLMENPQISRSMGKYGRKNAAERFNIKDIINNIEKIYATLGG